MAEPDRVVEHEPVRRDGCGASRDGNGGTLAGVEARQAFDLPPVAVEVTEHRAAVRRCACGTCTRDRAAFPDGVTHPVQYGARVRNAVVYLAQYQLVPMARIIEVLRDVQGLSISQGTVANSLERCHAQLEGFGAAAREAVRAGRCAHFDESGVRVGKGLHWPHVASNANVTWYTIHQPRDADAMRAMAVLPGYEGYAVHEHWNSYFSFEGVLPVLCNAHHLRELVHAHEQCGQGWAKWLIRALVEFHGEEA